MRHRVLIVVAFVAVLGAACVPPPEDPPPTDPRGWVPTVRGWSTDPAAPYELPSSATTEDWWAVVRQQGGWAGPATLELHRRDGAGGAPGAAPAFSFPLEHGAFNLAMSDHLVAVRARNPQGGQLPIELFEREGDTWRPAATVLRPVPGGSTFAIDLTDDHLLVGEQGSWAGTLTDGRAAVVPIDRTGPGVTIGAPTLLQPDPTWAPDARARFGAEVSIVGDLLAVSSEWDRLAIYRDTQGAGWALLDVLSGGNPLADGNFARAIDLDRGGAPRLAVGSAGGWNFGVPQPGRVEVYELTGSTWTVTHTIGPRSTSGLNGLGLGSEVELDGDLLAVSAHWASVQRPEQHGGGTVADMRVEIHDLAATPTFRDELSPYDAVGGIDAWPTASMVGGIGMELAGTHLVMTAYVGFGSDPAHYAAVSFDHR